jgi:glycosyltransferase 2 family protein
MATWEVSGRKQAISFAVAALLAAVLLYSSVRGIAWREVGRIIAGAAPGRLALAAAMATTALLLRACRWRILLNAEGSVTVPTVFWATAAGYFGNNFLPARGGELVRAFMISARSGLDGAYVLATALAERAADVVALVGISAIVLLTLPSPPGWLASAARPFAILGLIAAAGIVVLPFLGTFCRTAVERCIGPGAWGARLIALIEQGLRGLRAFHHVQRLSGFAGLTLVIWFLDAAGTIVTGAALGFATPLSVAFLLIAGLGLSSALPSTPGYIGIYQFVAVTVLTPFGFTRTDAIAYILVVQALGYVVIVFWGGLGLLRYRQTADMV